MATYDHLYCLTKFKPASMAALPSDNDERVYNGQLVFAGPDAAIVIRGEKIRGLINGEPSHPDGQLAEMIDNYRELILDAAKGLRERNNDTIIVAGRWHHIDPNEEPRFEAYLVHRIANEGIVTTARYDSEIFDWDDLNNGGRFGLYLSGDPVDDVDRLSACARDRVEPLTKWSQADGELPAIDGVLWYPDQGQDLPLVFSSVKTVEFSGDGTIVSTLRARAQALSKQPGVFRGKQVDRRTHRPPQLTLDEVLASTNALGYWLQHDYGSGEHYNIFVPSSDTQLMGGELLQRLEAKQDDDTLSCEYAGNWKLEKGMTKTRFRLLAVGSMPGLSLLPL